MTAWITRYEQQTGYQFDPNGVDVIPERGFITWSQPRPDTVYVSQIYGDGHGKWWHGFLEALCRKVGARRVVFPTVRNPKAWERAYGARLVGYLMAIDYDA